MYLYECEVQGDGDCSATHKLEKTFYLLDHFYIITCNYCQCECFKAQTVSHPFLRGSMSGIATSVVKGTEKEN